jgi:hypothetical protein
VNLVVAMTESSDIHPQENRQHHGRLSSERSTLGPHGVFQVPDPDHETYDDETPIEAQWKQRSSQGNNDRFMFISAYIILLLSVIGLVVAVTKYVQVTKNNNASTHVPPASTSIDGKVPKYPEYRNDLESTLQIISMSSSFLESSSPQAKALDWLAFDDQILVENDLKQEDPYAIYQRYSLIVLFFATNGELWDGTPWTTLSDVHECDFPGIDCDDNRQVVLMDMSFRKLRGRLPDEMGALTKLTRVSLKLNSLEGTIPSFFYHQLTNLSTSSEGLSQLMVAAETRTCLSFFSTPAMKLYVLNCVLLRLSLRCSVS